MVKETTTIDLTGTTVNYLQVVPMTFEEKVNMYMKCSKLELAKMLAERDRTDNLLQPQPFVYPWYPTYPNQPYYDTEPHITCNDATGYSTSCTYNSQYKEEYDEYQRVEDYEEYCKIMNKSDK